MRVTCPSPPPALSPQPRTPPHEGQQRVSLPRGPETSLPGAFLPSLGLHYYPLPWSLTGFLKELEQEMSRHKERRQQAALTEHLLRMETKPALTDLPQLPGEPMARDSSPSVTPRQRKETSPKPTSLSQATSATRKLCPLVSSQQSITQAKKGTRAALVPKASLAGAPGTNKTVTKRIKK